MNNSKQKIVICGAGYAGLSVANKIAGKAEITLINNNPNFEHVMKSHKIISNKVKSEDLTIRLRDFCIKRQMKFVNDEIISIDPKSKTVKLKRTPSVVYDKLVIALGTATNYFGIKGLEENSLSLKSISDGLKIKLAVENAFNKGAKGRTFVVCGGGLTGLEVITEISDYVGDLSNAKGVHHSESDFILVEAMDNIMPGFNEKSKSLVREYLEKHGIEIMTSSPVVAAEKGKITLKNGDKIKSECVVWAAGIKPNPVVQNFNIQLSERGAILVNEYLQSVSSEDIFAIGDCAFVKDTKPLQSARNATRQAEVAAKNVLGRKVPFFPEKEPPALISLGNNMAVFAKGQAAFGGYVWDVAKKFVEWNEFQKLK